MRMNISRAPSMADHGEESNVMMNMSLQAGKHLAQVLQMSGIVYVRLSDRETMGSRNLAMDEVHFFDGVPQTVFKWANKVLPGIASFMEAFGITEVSLDPAEDDYATLRRMWNLLESDRSQQVQRAERPTEPQESPKADPSEVVI